MTRMFALISAFGVSALLLTSLGQPPNDVTVVAIDWHAKESKLLQTKIDKAVAQYAELLAGQQATPGGRTLQALGLIAALPRLPEPMRKEYLGKAITLVTAEGMDFWPGDEKDAVDRASKLNPSASYHLPLVLLLIEHYQAGALLDGSSRLRDREMRFGIVPAKKNRKDIIRLLSLLLAAGYGKTDGFPNAFDDKMHPGAIWGYSSFGRQGQASPSCISPTGMAAIGLSAAVFGLNVLEYENDDYDIMFGGKQLNRKDIRDRVIDVCSHLIFSLVSHNQLSDRALLDALKPDTNQLDTEAFKEVVAPGLSGQPLVRIQARKSELDTIKTNGRLAIYRYQGNGAVGAYYSSCAAYTLATSARVLALALQREAKDDKPVGKHYRFIRVSEGKWRLEDAGGWSVELVPEGTRRYAPLRFAQAGKPDLDIDGAIAGSLNTCIACVTTRDGTNAERRTLRGTNKGIGEWLAGSSGDNKSFVALHAFAIYKAAVVTGDGYAIGRCSVWQELAEGLAREDFILPLVNATENIEKKIPANIEYKIAAATFSIMTMTRTYRPIFPKSDSPSK